MRWVLGVLGTAAVLGSLFGLTLPLSLHVVDRSGSPIACGTAFHPDQRRAAREDTVNRELHNSFGAPYESSDYGAQCDALISARRGVSAHVMAFGAALLGITCLLGFGVRSDAVFSPRSGGLPTPRRDPKPAPATVASCDDLHKALSTIGIRVQH